MIINHFNKDLLPSGYLGVDIFFVISGYVITSSLAKRKSKNLLDFLVGFYERRIKRLIPELALCVTITSIITHLFIQNAGSYYLTGALSLFGISNLYIFSSIGDYWGFDASMNPFTNTWSLGVEEQFYLLFPFLVWYSGFGGNLKNGRKKFFIWVSLLTLVSLSSFIYLNLTNPSAAYFLMPNRFWEIGIGCLTHIIFSKQIKIIKELEKIPPLIILTAILLLMFLPVTIIIPSIISTVVLTIILLLCLRKETFIFNLLTNPASIYIGFLSYSLYLWHWSVITLARWSVGITKTTTLPLIFLICILSIASYEIVGKNVRRKYWSSNRFATIIKGFITAIGVSIFSIFLGTGIRAKFYLGERQSTNPPENSLPNSVFHIFGDSHAEDIYNLLLNNGTYKLNKYTAGGCKFYFHKSLKCKVHNKNTARLIKSIESEDIIIFASNYLPSLLKEKKFESDSLLRFLDKVVPPITSKGGTIVLKLPHPEVNSPQVTTGLICKKEIFRPVIDPGCFVEGVSKSEFLTKKQTIMQPILKKIKKYYPSIIFWNIDNITCPGNKCFAVTKTNQYFVDDNHLFISSATLSDALVQDLNEVLKRNIGTYKLVK